MPLTVEQDTRRRRMETIRHCLRLSRADFATVLGLGLKRLDSYKEGRVPWPDMVLKQVTLLLLKDVEGLKAQLSHAEDLLHDTLNSLL